MDQITKASPGSPVARVQVSAPAWPTDFVGFLELLRDISSGDFVCLHAGSWIISQPGGTLLPVALVGTRASGERYAVSIVSAAGPEAALAAAAAPEEAPLTFEELAEAWSWYVADPAENDRLNVFLARLRWRRINYTDALWPTSMAFC